MSRSHLWLGSSLVIWLSVSAYLSANDWSRFRGPNGTGTASGPIPTKFDDQTNVLWKVKLPGQGNSSPVVAHGKIFLESATASERALVCLDAVTGKTLWSRSTSGSKAKTHAKNSLASSTPCVDSERVYAIFWDGDKISLQAFSLEGKPVWKKELGSYTSQHGPGMSPIVARGKVFLNYDQDGTAELLAFDASNGNIAWRASRTAYRACYSTPMLLEEAGKPAELLVASTAGVTSYSPEAGTVNWNWNWEWKGKKMPLRTVASPIVGSGLVLVMSGDGGGSRTAIAVKHGGQGDISSSGLAWEKVRDFPYVPTPLISGDHLYWVNDKGRAACYETATGKEVWTETLGGGFSSSPILVDGNIYAFDESGTCYVFKAQTKYELVARNRLKEDVIATPAVADGRLYVRGATHLYAIGTKK